MDGDRTGRAIWKFAGWQPALGALALLTLVRLAAAAATPLAPDEAYYWIWSRALAAGYLDHPPMVALWIRAGIAIAGSGSIGVRLLGPVSAAAGSVLLYDAAERLFPGRRAGLVAAVLLNATLTLNAGAIIMTPDTPLLFFWTAALWAGARLAAGGAAAWWIAAGVFAGGALVSKYTAALLPAGLGLFAVWSLPRAFRRPEPYVGALAAALLFLPVVLWNADHQWAGFLRQGGRIGDWRPERAAGFLAELVFGQIGLATPGIFVLFAAGCARAVRMAARTRAPAWSLLAALSLPPALVFLQHAIGDRVQGNWPAVLYPAAAIAASGLTAPIWRRWVWPSSAVGFGVAALVYAHAVSGWPTDPRDPVARQLSGWPGLAATIDAARLAAGASEVVAEPYGLAAELARELPAGSRVAGFGARWRLTALPLAEGGPGATTLLVRPERYGDRPDADAWRDAVPLAIVSRSSGGVDIERYRLFLVRAAPGTEPGVWLRTR